MTAFTGTGRLIRLALRRDRIQLPIWILGSAVSMAGVISSVLDRFPTEQDRIFVLRTAVDTPALLLARSAPTGASLGEVYMFEALPFMAVVAGLMSTFAIVRHTRQNEETGRTEMIGALRVGRHAPLTAALIVTVAANILLGLLMALTLIGNDESAAGSFAAGAATAGAGVAFAAITAVVAQITQGARAANGIAGVVVGAAYVIRGVGDVLGEVQPNGYTMVTGWPSWLSPVGWAMQVRPFADNRWWVLLAPLALFVIGVAVAFALTERRDVGMGMIADRPGRPAASPRLLSPLGLAWRLQRGTLIGWAVAFVISGLGVGSIGGSAIETLGSGEDAVQGVSDTINKLSPAASAANLADAFNAAMIALFGAMAACYLVQALQRLRSEEAGGRAEEVLATATGRARWLASHLIVAVVGTIVLLALAALSMGATLAPSTDDAGRTIADLLGAAFAQLPAALILAGFAVTAFGLLPRFAIGLAWAGFAVSLLVGQLGELFNLPQAIRDISPFSHVPALPSAEFIAAPLVAMSVVAVALGAAGVALFRRRSLAI